MLWILIGKVRTYSIILADPSGKFSERARQDLGEAVPKLSRLTDTAAAILPTDVYIELNRLQTSVIGFLADCDEGQIDEAFPKTLGVRAVKVALLARSILGIDELSEESIKLFGSTKEVQRLASLTADDVRTIVNSET